MHLLERAGVPRVGDLPAALGLGVAVLVEGRTAEVHTEIGDDDQRQTITGLTLAVQGVVLTLLSIKDDLIYDYEPFDWETDESFFAYMDRLGISGVLYSIIGLFIMFNSLNLESMAYLLTTVYLVVLGIQGFSEESDARWRRGVGGYGSILTAFLFANSLNNELFSGIATVMSGMVALGFGFMFMQRLNDDDGIYQSADDAPRNTPGASMGLPLMPAQTQPKVEATPDVRKDKVEVVDDKEEILDL